MRVNGSIAIWNETFVEVNVKQVVTFYFLTNIKSLQPLILWLEAFRHLLRYRHILNELRGGVYLLDAAFCFQQDEVSDRLR